MRYVRHNIIRNVSRTDTMCLVRRRFCLQGIQVRGHNVYEPIWQFRVRSLIRRIKGKSVRKGNEKPFIILDDKTV